MPEEPKKEKPGTCPGCGSQFTYPPSMSEDEKSEIKRELAEIRSMLASKAQARKAKSDALEDIDADEEFSAEELRLMGISPAAEIDEDENE